MADTIRTFPEWDVAFRDAVWSAAQLLPSLHSAEVEALVRLRHPNARIVVRHSDGPDDDVHLGAFRDG